MYGVGFTAKMPPNADKDDVDEDGVGWERVTEQISKRVDALEAMIARLMGQPPPQLNDRKWFGVAPLTWVAVITALGTLGATAATILQQGP